MQMFLMNNLFWETSDSLWAAVQSGSNIIYHAAGWLGRLIASPEKFIMDCEIIQQIQRYMDPEIPTDQQHKYRQLKKLVALDILELNIHKVVMKVLYQPFLSDWKTMRHGRRLVQCGRLNVL